MKATLENLSKTAYKPEFLRDFKELGENTKLAVAEAIEELAADYLTQPWNHPQVKYIPRHGKIWRLKIGNQGQQIDHRIFFDITDEGLIFLTIQHRDHAYQS